MHARVHAPALNWCHPGQLRPQQLLPQDCRALTASTSCAVRRPHVRGPARRNKAIKLQASSLQTEPTADAETSSLTKRKFEEVERRKGAGQAGGAGGLTSYEAFKRMDETWSRVKTMKKGREAGEAPRFVTTSPTPLPRPPAFDVAVCGGTLGIFYAAALQLRGIKTAVLERGPLRGRDQDWNISRRELDELVELGVLSESEAESCISIEFNPVRAGFHGGPDVWTRDVLNLGVSPQRLIDKVKERFEAAGGQVLEFTGLEGVAVHENGVSLALGQPPPGVPAVRPSVAENGAEEEEAPAVTARLLVDCMGNASPIVRQIRWGRKPDGICLVVGSCSRGFPPNPTADVIYTCSPIENGQQVFWEAFPAGSGNPADRTTYMFTYCDADKARPSLEEFMELYWRSMPAYQGVSLDDLEVLRILFGFFPTFRDSPLRPAFDRVLQVGDASGIQSPLSFGGFGALTRHLARTTAAISQALAVDALDRGSLAYVNPYNPGVRGMWMLQRAMSVRPGQLPAPDFINNLLGKNFQVMQRLGDPVLKPFLQDVVQFGPLARTMLGQLLAEPLFVPSILRHVGFLPLLDWLSHFIALGLFTALHGASWPLAAAAGKLPARQQFYVRRSLEAWEYGSGADLKK